MKILDLDYYVLFVFKDISEDKLFSTMDINVLKQCVPSEEFVIGEKITFNDKTHTIKEISLSKVGGSLNNDHDYGWSAEEIYPQGVIKDILFRVTITLV
jgi:hypothetical protein